MDTFNNIVVLKNIFQTVLYSNIQETLGEKQIQL